MFKHALIVFLAAEGLAILSFKIPVLYPIILLTVGVLAFLLTMKNSSWGVYILFGELFVGSRGHLLEYAVGGFSVSIRLVVFVGVLVGWLVFLIQNAKIKTQNDNAKFKIDELLTLPRSYWLLLVVIFFGAVNGYLRGNGISNVFLDANGYLYFLVLPLVWQSVKSREVFENILKILGAAILVIALKTLILFFWFSFGFAGVATLYAWIIQSDLGEITGEAGSASRIFMQSQFYALVGIFIFSLPAFFASVLLNEGGKKNPKDWVIVGSAILSVLLSLSRSFWLGGIVAAFFVAMVLWIRFRVKVLKIIKFGLVLFCIAVIEVGILYAVISLGQKGVANAVASRAMNPAIEAAGSARISLLKELLFKIQTSPFLGSGFGAELKFKSYLPDKVSPENPEGEVTTFAFEWGYLDILFKVGLIGALVYAVFLVHIFKLGWKNPKNLGILTGLVALLVLNITTPYLNHPLGIGYLMLSLIAFRDYEQTAG